MVKKLIVLSCVLLADRLMAWGPGPSVSHVVHGYGSIRPVQLYERPRFQCLRIQKALFLRRLSRLFTKRNLLYVSLAGGCCYWALKKYQSWTVTESSSQDMPKSSSGTKLESSSSPLPKKKITTELELQKLIDEQLALVKKEPLNTELKKALQLKNKQFEDSKCVASFEKSLGAFTQLPEVNCNVLDLEVAGLDEARLLSFEKIVRCDLEVAQNALAPRLFAQDSRKYSFMVVGTVSVVKEVSVYKIRIQRKINIRIHSDSPGQEPTLVHEISFCLGAPVQSGIAI